MITLSYALRAKERKRYTEEGIDDDEIEGKRNFDVLEKVNSDIYTGDYVQNLIGADFTLKYVQETGLNKPIVIEDKAGLGMRIPSSNFKVSDVKRCVGSRRNLDVMDVNTQKGLEMNMKDWVKYYETEDRDRLLNVISLEFSHTRLETYVDSPTVVRQIDWVDCAWPRYHKENHIEATNIIENMKYPKVQKYCLMSVAGCFTDFHIDFGGTSVWYHILHGEKIFWLIPPTEENTEMYENWVLSGKQGDIFLADTVTSCQKVVLKEGYTFIIPSGWIHAVYTPKDSLVFGGNFIHSYNILQQLRVSEMEDKTRVPQKFRYPFYTEMMWYVLAQYISCLTGKSYLKKQDKNEKNKSVLAENGEHSEESPEASKNVKVEENEDKKVPNGVDSVSRPVRAKRKPAKVAENGETENEGDTKVKLERENSDLSEKDGLEDTKTDADTPASKKWIHLTPFEIKGLTKLMGWLEKLPATKRSLPKDLKDADTLLEDLKDLLTSHEDDDHAQAVTGEEVIKWPASSVKLMKMKIKQPGTPKASKLGKNAAGNRRRRTRCKKCPACIRGDCGECHFCEDMKKFGGPGRMKQSCISRQCMAPELPNTATCIICGTDDRNSSSQNEGGNFATVLMECGICWEILHPRCLKEKFENLDVDNEGIINEDLPNSWECPKCSTKDPSTLKGRPGKGGNKDGGEKSEAGESASSEDETESTGSKKRKTIEGKRVTSKIGSVGLKKKTVIPTKLKLQSPSTKNESKKVELPKGLKSPPVVTRSGRTVVAKRAPGEDDDLISPLKRQRKEEVTVTVGQGRGRGKKGQGSSPGATGRGQGLRVRSETPTPGTSRGRGRGRGKGKPGSFEISPNNQSVSSSANTPDSKHSSRGGTPVRSEKTPSSDPGSGKGKNKQKTAAKSIPDEPPVKQIKTIPPKYVIRPAPIPPPADMLELEGGNKHPLPRLTWLEILRYVNHSDLARCMSVCKTLNRWCIDKSLWRELDLSHKKIKQLHLVGIVRRQPVILNLNYAVIAPKQLSWLIERLPHLRHLSLAYCSWTTLSALCCSTCPLLTYLDLSWASGLRDSCFTDLISPSMDSRPAVRIVSRLHKCEELQMAGTDISDSSLEIIPRHLTFIKKLDLSYCIKLTNQGIEYLMNEETATRYNIRELDLTGCNQLTGDCLMFLANCPKLVRLKLKACHKISIEDCQAFTMTYVHRKLILRDDFDKLIVCADEDEIML